MFAFPPAAFGAGAQQQQQGQQQQRAGMMATPGAPSPPAPAPSSTPGYDFGDAACISCDEAGRLFAAVPRRRGRQQQGNSGGATAATAQESVLLVGELHRRVLDAPLAASDALELSGKSGVPSLPPSMVVRTEPPLDFAPTALSASPDGRLVLVAGVADRERELLALALIDLYGAVPDDKGEGDGDDEATAALPAPRRLSPSPLAIAARGRGAAGTTPTTAAAPPSPSPSSGAPRRYVASLTPVHPRVFSSRPGLRVLQVSWHPGGGGLGPAGSGGGGAGPHFAVLSSDARWRLYNAARLAEAEQTFHLRLDTGPAAAAAEGGGGGLTLGLASATRRRTATAPRPVAFCFGASVGSGSGGSDATSNTHSSSSSSTGCWAPLSVLFLATDGGVYNLCPVAPFGLRVSGTALRALLREAPVGTPRAWVQAAFGADAIARAEAEADAAAAGGGPPPPSAWRVRPHLLETFSPALQGPLNGGCESVAAGPGAKRGDAVAMAVSAYVADPMAAAALLARRQGGGRHGRRRQQQRRRWGGAGSGDDGSDASVQGGRGEDDDDDDDNDGGRLGRLDEEEEEGEEEEAGGGGVPASSSSSAAAVLTAAAGGLVYAHAMDASALAPAWLESAPQCAVDARGDVAAVRAECEVVAPALWEDADAALDGDDGDDDGIDEGGEGAGGGGGFFGAAGMVASQRRQPPARRRVQAPPPLLLLDVLDLRLREGKEEEEQQGEERSVGDGSGSGSGYGDDDDDDSADPDDDRRARALRVRLHPCADAPGRFWAVHEGGAWGVHVPWLPQVGAALQRAAGGGNGNGNGNGGGLAVDSLPAPKLEELLVAGPGGVADSAPASHVLLGGGCVVLERGGGGDGGETAAAAHDGGGGGKLFYLRARGCRAGEAAAAEAKADEEQSAALAAAAAATGAADDSARPVAAPAPSSADDADHQELRRRVDAFYAPLVRGPRPLPAPAPPPLGRPAGPADPEGMAYLGAAAAHLRAKHGAFAALAHGDLAHRAAQLQAEAGRQARCERALADLAEAAEQRAALLAERAARLRDVQHNLDERLRLLASLHWSVPRPLSDAELSLGRQLDRWEAAAREAELGWRPLQKRLAAMVAASSSSSGGGGGKAAASIPPSQLPRLHAALAQNQQIVAATTSRLDEAADDLRAFLEDAE
jgi:hypothetical protein